MQNTSVTEVFTPTKPATLTFVERKSIQDKLVNTLKTPGKQVVVYGHSGSGKSTLLINKLRQLYEEHVTTRCIKGMTYDQILLDAFDQLDKYFKSSSTVEVSVGIDSSIKVEYANIKSQLSYQRQESQRAEERRIIPPQLTAQRLAKFLGEAKCCWVLEDFHKVDEKDKVKLSQTMKVFMDTAVDYSDVKIILIGAVNTAREVVTYDAEMHNRVSEIYVPLMSQEEIYEILEKGEKILNVTFSGKVKDEIVRYSTGLAAIAHQLALNCCYSSGVYETQNYGKVIDKEDLQSAVQEYIENESDTIKNAFDLALKRKRGGKYDNCKIILSALARSKSMEGMTRSELMQEIKNFEPNYPEGNLSRYLNELTTAERGALVRYDDTSNKFAFSNPFHKTFALALIGDPQKRELYLTREISSFLNKKTQQSDMTESFVKIFDVIVSEINKKNK